MSIAITGFYAALLTFVYAAIFALVGKARNAAGVSLGDGGNPDLIVTMRRQMNFVENVPLALILIACVEAGGAAKWWVHALGLVLLAARIVHPFGMDFKVMERPARGIGAGGTALVMIAAAITLLWQFI